MDSFTVKAIRDELNKVLLQGRLQRISEIRPDVFLFSLRCTGRNRTLLLSCAPSHPAVHLTERTFQAIPPSPFCMVLRKHLIGTILQEIRLPHLERVLTFIFHRRKESGVLQKRHVVIEIMGRRSNLLLLDGESGKILDCARHIPAARNRFRQLLPGRIYVSPPHPDKIDLSSVPPDRIPADLLERPDAHLWLVEQIAGLSPHLAREVICCGRENGVQPELKKMANIYDSSLFTPALYRSSVSGALLLTACMVHYLPDWEKTSFPSMNQAADRYQEITEGTVHTNALRKPLQDTLQTALKRLGRTMKRIQGDLDSCKELNTLRQKGEWIQGNLYKIEKGMTEAWLDDPHGEDSQPLRVDLDPTLAPWENAQLYFRRYRKLQRRKEAAHNRFHEVDGETVYLQQVLETVREADDPIVLEEIREELVEGNYLPLPRKKKNGKIKTSAPPLCFVSSEGHTLLVGRNNRCNDRLITRTARQADLWFHAHRIPGAHVILRNPQRQEISERVLTEAAILAAYYSKARNSSKVPVDYTLRKYVRKFPGAPPGMVTIRNEKTLLVSPRKEKLPAPCPEGGISDPGSSSPGP